MAENVMYFLRLFLIIVAGLYFFMMLKGQFSGKGALSKESEEEMERLRLLNKIKLSKSHILKV